MLWQWYIHWWTHCSVGCTICWRSEGPRENSSVIGLDEYWCIHLGTYFSVKWNADGRGLGALCSWMCTTVTETSKTWPPMIVHGYFLPRPFSVYVYPFVASHFELEKAYCNVYLQVTQLWILTRFWRKSESSGSTRWQTTFLYVSRYCSVLQIAWAMSSQLGCQITGNAWLCCGIHITSTCSVKRKAKGALKCRMKNSHGFIDQILTSFGLRHDCCWTECTGVLLLHMDPTMKHVKYIRCTRITISNWEETYE